MESHKNIETIAEDIYQMLRSDWMNTDNIDRVLKAAKKAFDLQYVEIFNSWLGDSPFGNNEERSRERYKKTLKRYISSKEEGLYIIETLLKGEGSTKKSSLKAYILRCLLLMTEAEEAKAEAVTPEESETQVKPKKTKRLIVLYAATACERAELAELRELFDAQPDIDLIALRKALCKKICGFDEDDLMKKAAHHIAEKLLDKANLEKIKQAVLAASEEYKKVAVLSLIKSWVRVPDVTDWDKGPVNDVVNELVELLDGTGAVNPTSLKGFVLKQLALFLIGDKVVIDASPQGERPSDPPMNPDAKSKFLRDIQNGKVDLEAFLKILFQQIKSEINTRKNTEPKKMTEDETSPLIPRKYK